MKRTLRALLAALLLPLAVSAAFLGVHPASAASLTRVTNFGNNPTNLNMYLYVPSTVAPRPALLVLVHYCSGSASAIFNGNGHDYVTAADRYGYIIVLPEATRSGSCFDVSTPAALTRNGGSDSTGIMSMVGYVRQHYNVDPGRIVVSGFSSGAMMTNVLAAEYPDVFAAGAAFSGVPAGCFATTDGSLWNNQCSGGSIIKTAQQWGDTARAMYPGYTGNYPRMQLWHGTTDTTLAYPNFGEEIKQWTNLHGLSQTPNFTDHPQSTWTRTRYGNTGTQATVEGVSIQGVGHQLPMTGQLAYAISFLGLDSASTTPTTAPPTTTPPTTTADHATDHRATDHHPADNSERRNRLRRHLPGHQQLARRLPGQRHSHQQRGQHSQRLGRPLHTGQRTDNHQPLERGQHRHHRRRHRPQHLLQRHPRAGGFDVVRIHRKRERGRGDRGYLHWFVTPEWHTNHGEP